MADDIYSADQARAWVEKSMANIRQVFGMAGPNILWPEAWNDLPFANVEWVVEEGDPSVGISGWSGLCLSADQSGTVMGNVLALQHDPKLGKAVAEALGFDLQ